MCSGMAGVPERGLKQSSGWNALQNVEVEVFGGLLGTQSLSDHHLCSCAWKVLSVMGFLTDSVPNFYCSSSLLSTLRRQRSQTSGASPGGLFLERERDASSQGPLQDFVPPAPLCSPDLLWVVNGWEVHQTRVLILGREPGFQ